MVDNKEKFYFYWGKAGSLEDTGLPCHLLPYHCLDVAAVGKVLLDKDRHLCRMLADITGLSEEIHRPWLCFFLGLHDVGKFSESFQNCRGDLLQNLQGRSSAKVYSVHHDSLGFSLWKEGLWDAAWSEGLLIDKAAESEKRRWESAFKSLAGAACGHHGQAPKAEGPNNLPISLEQHFNPTDIEAAERFVREVAGLFKTTAHAENISHSAKDLKALFQKASWFLAGIVVVCDWIASGYFPFIMKAMPLEEYWWEYALPVAEKAVSEAGILPCSAASDLAHTRLFPHIETLTPLQGLVSNCEIGDDPQLFILEDVTGSGKTEAALMLAGRLISQSRATGLFFALPTMATSNAMYDRLAPIYKKLFANDTSPSIVLTHSSRHLSEAFLRSVLNQRLSEHNSYGKGDNTASAQCASWLADNRKKALLSDVGVGTLDQALLAILPSRHQSLRLFGLARHVLIVDEVHAFDPYMNTLLQNLLRFHAALGGSAILLSATLPVRIRKDLVNSFNEGLALSAATLDERDSYPLMTRTSFTLTAESPVAVRPQSRISIGIKLIHDIKSVIDLIRISADNGKCVCWIRNTVDDAIEAYEALKSHLSPAQLMLFHARFAMGDRLDIEKQVCMTFDQLSVAEMRKAKVLVATQVVEQSLDLDFDVLISDLAPIDLLIQRAGRLHRHARDADGNPLTGTDRADHREPACLYILSPNPDDQACTDWYKAFFPKAAYVYPSHGRLWLTARLLRDKGHWRMPEDARYLIETAFSEEQEDSIPEALRQRDFEAEAKRMCDKSLAHLNMLKIEDGYAATPGQWLEDTKTPTRLGEVQTTVRLARWDGKELLPWYDKGDYPWDMSQVNVRQTLVHSELEHSDAALRAAVQSLKECLPDKGKWSVLIPLVLVEEGIWQGHAKNIHNIRVTVEYSPAIGLRVFSDGGQNGF